MEDADDKAMLARIDERTQAIMQRLDGLASCERVDALEGRIDRHVETHDKKGGVIATWVGIAVAAVLGLAGIVKGSTP
ncbi:MAG: hypothetical protein WC815_23905 [Vicinamibacterales bacterium]|jgi:hypothetical protein